VFDNQLEFKLQRLINFQKN